MVLFRFLFAPVLLAVAVLAGSPDRPVAAGRPAAAPAPRQAVPRAESRVPRAHPAPVR